MVATDLTRGSQSYWDIAADTYEQDFTTTLIGQLLRRRVWRELDRIFRPDDRLLELNCGTGIDAVYLARKGMTVMACDISSRMVEQARRRADQSRLSGNLDFRVLATEELSALTDNGQFDGAYSNFSGLNCVGDLVSVRRNLARLLKPGGSVALCMLGRFVPWEIAWFFAHGDPRKAMRRLRPGVTPASNNGAPHVRYHPRQEIVAAFSPEFQLRRWKGIGIFLPPSYMEHQARRFPRTIGLLDRVDGLVGDTPIFRSMADFVLLEFQRTENENG